MPQPGDARRGNGRVAWHALSREEVLRRLDVPAASGLSEEEVARRRASLGENRLREARPTPHWWLFLQQFQDFMVLVLIGAALVSYALGEEADAVTILAIVILNAWLGFLQEYRAEKSLAALKRLTAPTARVLRGGELVTVAAADVVPGDLLLLEAGDRVAADVRLLEAFGLACDESALTGESVPVSKDARRLEAARAVLAERRNMAFQGTVVTRGRGSGVAVATGMATEMGHIAALIQSARPAPTPLQRRLEQLGRYLVAGCLLVSAVVVVGGILRGEPPYQMFLAGVSLAVAAIPEGLPAIVTVSLALGVQRMIRVHAIVRRLPAVETLGSATLIASDKTGTLTQNAMTVRRLLLPDGACEVTGHGYDVAGLVTPPRAGARLALRAAALCNNARLRREGTRWSVQGDPTEAALLVAAGKVGLDPQALRQAVTRQQEFPFEPERRRMAVICAEPEGLVLYAKGAPDTILARCTRYYRQGRVQVLPPEQRQDFVRQAEELASAAMRVLAVAYRPLAERGPGGPGEAAAAREESLAPAEPRGSLQDASEAAERELVQDLTFLGLIAMSDPARPEAAAAVAECRRAGIRPVMITGDHLLTARAIARELGILRPDGLLLEGEQLEAMSDAELARRIGRIDVFARVSPSHKLRIVRALRARGEVVAMTGDGVNDAPAVREADIGVAMGSSGTEVTKEAAAMVLTNDNFATIVAAVREGRAIYDNIRKFIRYLLACNTGEVLTMFFATLFDLPLPLLPIQILLVNLVTDGLPAMALGIDPPAPDVMNRPPRPRSEGIFARGLWQRIVRRGVLIAAATLLVFTWGAARQGVEVGRTMATTTLVLCQLWHVFDCRSEGTRRPLRDLALGNPWLLGAVTSSAAVLVAVIYVPLLQSAFQAIPLMPGEWLTCLAAAAGTALAAAVAERLRAS